MRSNSTGRLNGLSGQTLDPDGQSGGATLESTYFFYDGNQIVLQFDGPEATGLTNRYLWVPGVDHILADEQVNWDEGQQDWVTDTVVWPLADHLGTLRDPVESDDTPGADNPMSMICQLQGGPWCSRIHWL